MSQFENRYSPLRLLILSLGHSLYLLMLYIQQHIIDHAAPDSVQLTSGYWALESLFGLKLAVSSLAILALCGIFKSENARSALCAGALIALNLLILLDSEFFRQTGEYFRLPGIPSIDSWPLLGSSLSNQVTLWHLVDLSLAVGIPLLVVYRFQSTERWFYVQIGLAMAMLVGIIFAPFATSPANQFSKGTIYPLHGLAIDLTQMLHPPQFVEHRGTPKSSANPLITSLGRKNLVLIVLESVGYQQLLMMQKMHRESKGNLFQTLGNFDHFNLLFDNLFVNQPNTAHSLFNINTGGIHPSHTLIHRALRNPIENNIGKYLKHWGYSTAVFSAANLDYENTRNLFSAPGTFDYVFDFGQQSAEFQEANLLNSWGGRDDVVFRHAQDWFIRSTELEKPVFLEFITNASHHPYNLPGEIVGLRMPASETQRAYLNALAFIDQSLTSFINALREKGRLDNTIIALVGDHGESFFDSDGSGRFHFGLSDSVVRSFLWILDPDHTGPSRVFSQLGSLSDVFPTLAGILGYPTDSLAGQDLLISGGRSRVFFQRISLPGNCGSLDNQWKFIGDERLEHYVLLRRNSPSENRNLAHEYPKITEKYRGLCEQWYRKQEQEYRAFSDPQTKDMSSWFYGPQVTLIKSRAHSSTSTEAQKIFHPNDRIYAETHWVPFTDRRKVRYTWLAPNGKTYHQNFILPADAIEASVELQAPFPLAEGKWQLQIGDQNKIYDEVFFRISSDAKYLSYEDPKKRLRHTYLTARNPQTRDYMIHSEWLPHKDLDHYRYLVETPDGQQREIPIVVASGGTLSETRLRLPYSFPVSSIRISVWHENGQVTPSQTAP